MIFLSVKEYFPGANTPDGFYSYYDHILTSDEALNVVILKGGPGTGKSSLMKKTASKALSLGYDVEFLHCSSDPESLDGVCVREKGFLIADGTSPHVIDPRYPGAVDKIINLGEFWNEDCIRPHKQQIQKLSCDIGAEFGRSYCYMSACAILQNRIKSSLDFDFKIVLNELESTKKLLGIGKSYGNGKVRKAFMGALTHLGKVCYADTFAADAKCIIKIVPDTGMAWEKYMRLIADEFVKSGFSIRAFYSHMNPSSVIEHIYIEDSNTFITSQNNIDNINYDKIINFDEYFNQSLSDEHKSDISMCDELTLKTVSALKRAKMLHDELEKLYIPHMNFEMINQIDISLNNQY